MLHDRLSHALVWGDICQDIKTGGITCAHMPTPYRLMTTDNSHITLDHNFVHRATEKVGYGFCFTLSIKVLFHPPTSVLYFLWQECSNQLCMALASSDLATYLATDFIMYVHVKYICMLIAHIYFMQDRMQYSWQRPVLTLQAQQIHEVVSFSKPTNNYAMILS